jgi:CheY-like chemotaxis protein
VDIPADEPITFFANRSLLAGRYVSLEVSDDGSGMDETTLRQIFNPFFTTKLAGRGLGLSAVVGMVHGYMGAIRVLSEVGKGSYFQVVFPVASLDKVGVAGLQVEKPQPEVDHLPQRFDPAASISRRASILVIEDEPIVSSTMKLMIESDGHTVVVAGNGREGIRLYQMYNNRFDLVIVDLTMPVMGGEETIRALQSINPEINVVVCTGHSESDAGKLREIGVRGIIPKPFRESFLRSEVEKYLVRKT